MLKLLLIHTESTHSLSALRVPFHSNANSLSNRFRIPGFRIRDSYAVSVADMGYIRHRVLSEHEILLATCYVLTPI
jgi:hypothetical protein